MVLIPGEPEMVAKNLPCNSIEAMKRRVKKCLRCGELMLIPENTTQSFCQTCRGGEMSINDYLRFKETWNSGIVVTGILEDARR